MKVREQLARVHSLLLMCGFREIKSGHKLGGKCPFLLNCLVSPEAKVLEEQAVLTMAIKRKTENRTCYSHMKTEEDAATNETLTPNSQLYLCSEIFSNILVF